MCAQQEGVSRLWFPRSSFGIEKGRRASPVPYLLSGAAGRVVTLCRVLWLFARGAECVTPFLRH